MADTGDGEPELTVREAGRRGGNAVRKKYGLHYYSEIAKIAGDKVAAERGREFYVEIGKKGGSTVKSGRDANYYATIGKMGGDLIKAKYGRDYFVELNHKRNKHKS